MKNCDDSSLNDVHSILSVTEKLNSIKDLDMLLNAVLTYARTFCCADAGSIFLKSGEKLSFRYMQNGSLKKSEANRHKHIYKSFLLPIDKSSVAGYVAVTGEAVIINDVETLGDDLAYRFNSFYDTLSNYRTESMLTVPLSMSGDRIIGVIQIINSTYKKCGKRGFQEEHKNYVRLLANNASIAIERTEMTREMILRMISMAELRDPKETGAHVTRVGAYSIEIYDRWAKKQNIPQDEVELYKDNLRIASMLHDVGKVGISDTILKKRTSLTEDEFSIMRSHCEIGASLFHGKDSALDKLSVEIALNHHEKYDGTGYPHGLVGEEIPLAARIVALADVYDALSSSRVYKDEWCETEVISYLKEHAGTHFDPALVEVFFEIYEVVCAVSRRYPDKESSTTV